MQSKLYYPRLESWGANTPFYELLLHVSAGRKETSIKYLITQNCFWRERSVLDASWGSVFTLRPEKKWWLLWLHLNKWKGKVTSSDKCVTLFMAYSCSSEFCHCAVHRLGSQDIRVSSWALFGTIWLAACSIWFIFTCCCSQEIHQAHCL